MAKNIGCLIIGMLMIIRCNSINKTEPLYQTTIFTPPSSFTSGAEGPAVDKEGNIYAVNYHHEGTIGMITPDGKSSLFVDLPAGSIGNGIRFDAKGDLFVADYTGHNVLKVDMKTKGISVYAHDSTMNQPNDLAIDTKDRLYASDPNWKHGTGKLWRIDPNGKTTLLDSTMGTTNGIEVSPDEKTLYVNESVQKKVWAFDLDDNGDISNKRVLIEFADHGMDGMRCDTKGNLYITRYGKGVIAIVAPDGALVKEVALTGKSPSNIAFGGLDGKTAYVTLQDTKNMESFKAEFPGREWVMQHQKK